VEKICRLLLTLGNSLDLEEVLAGFDRDLRRIFPYEAISLHLLEGGQLRPAYAAGEEFARLASLTCVVGSGWLGQAAATARPQANVPVDGLGALRSALVFPLAGADGVSAVLGVYRTGSSPFDAADFETLAAVGPKLAAAIDNARRYATVARVAGIDPATGLLNGRALFQRLDAELARARRSGEPLALLQCSIDGWENAPTQAIANCLRSVAAALLAGCREYDAVAWNGDVFILILAGLGPAGANEKCRCIERLARYTGTAAGLPLAARIGAAFFPADSADAEGLLATAAQRAVRPGNETVVIDLGALLQ
jgi:GGDEF domain-containing protein